MLQPDTPMEGEKFPVATNVCEPTKFTPSEVEVIFIDELNVSGSYSTQQT